MEHFAKIVNGLKLLIIFAKCCVFKDVWQRSEYTSDTYIKQDQRSPIKTLGFFPRKILLLCECCKVGRRKATYRQSETKKTRLKTLSKIGTSDTKHVF